MIDKRVPDPATAVARIADGATVAVGGFGNSGMPHELLIALMDHGASDLTIIANNAGEGDSPLALLLRERRVRKVICSYPRSPGSVWFEKRYEEGSVELEVVPQGTLAERLRAAGAGLGGFFTPTAFGTLLAEGKETRIIDGVGYVLEAPLAADVALIHAEEADRWGNLRYHRTAQNFNPVMATAARHVIAQVRKSLDAPLDPESVVTPGIFVDSIVEIGARL